MPDMPVAIRQIDASEAETLAPQLIALLQDAVASGASLGFWNPLDDDRAQAYWDDVIAGVRAGSVWLLVAQRAASVVGSVRLRPPPSRMPPAVRRSKS